jgi:hypothetical protein
MNAQYLMPDAWKGKEKVMGPTTSIEIWCDAPPYSVVEGCSLIGVRTPEDVRWCRLSHLRDRCGRRALLRAALSWLWRLARPAPTTPAKKCSCGADLPAFQSFRLLVHPDDLPTYLIGQCSRCHTVFWEEDRNHTDD